MVLTRRNPMMDDLVNILATEIQSYIKERNNFLFKMTVNYDQDIRMAICYGYSHNTKQFTKLVEEDLLCDMIKKTENVYILKVILKWGVVFFLINIVERECLLLIDNSLQSDYYTFETTIEDCELFE
jgi:hypothetical protein